MQTIKITVEVSRPTGFDVQANRLSTLASINPARVAAEMR